MALVCAGERGGLKCKGPCKIRPHVTLMCFWGKKRLPWFRVQPLLNSDCALVTLRGVNQMHSNRSGTGCVHCLWSWWHWGFTLKTRCYLQDSQSTRKPCRPKYGSHSVGSLMPLSLYLPFTVLRALRLVPSGVQTCLPGVTDLKLMPTLKKEREKSSPTEGKNKVLGETWFICCLSPWLLVGTWHCSTQ